jgi:hypothetical protein
VEGEREVELVRRKEEKGERRGGRREGRKRSSELSLLERIERKHRRCLHPSMPAISVQGALLPRIRTRERRSHQ